jgi:hypothetical protein
MPDSIKPPSIFGPVAITVCALLDLSACFFMILSPPRFLLFAWMLLCEGVLIAIALWCWVDYFRDYVDYVIDSRSRLPSSMNNGIICDSQREKSR